MFGGTMNHAEQLALIQRSFETALHNCPAEAAGRQRFMVERRAGHLYVQIMTSFRIDVPGDSVAVGTDEARIVP
jgi:hypothetical protein